MGDVAAMLAALERGEVTSEALVAGCLAKIRERDGAIGAFLSVDEEGALAAARQSDRDRAAGEPMGVLAGIPVAVKDNINIRDRITTCGSKMLARFRAPYDAHVIERVRAAGAVLIGKTNLDEFAMGSSTEFSAFGPTRNPADTARVPGGSSGGSTAAVAAGMVPLALGSSTGGSIRQPASFCGVVGIKPTYGRVSRYGLVAFGSSLDQIGVVAGDVDGAARLLHVIAGHDNRDATSLADPVADYVAACGRRPRPLRVGLVEEFTGLQNEVAACRERLVATLRDNGAEIVSCSFPHAAYAVPAYYLVATAEASSNLARFDGVRYGYRAAEARSLGDLYVRSRSEGFGPEVKRRILLGTYCLSSGYYDGYYLNAQKVRTRLIEDFQRAFAQVDVLLAPTSPTTAFKLGEKTKDPVAMYLNDIYTVTANLAGVPAISIPAGRDRGGLPIGMQLMAPRLREAELLSAAAWMERLLTTDPD